MKIKTSIFYSLAAFALMGGVANAQSSATDPVGFHTLKVAGAPVDGTRISLLSPGLVNPIEYASATTAVTDTTITFEGTPFADDDYGIVPADPNVPPVGQAHAAYIAYYVEVTSGPEAGAWANITASTDNTLTVDRDLTAAGQTEKIAIRRHVNISDLFGAANEAGLDGDGEGLISGADEIILFDGTSSTVIFYVDAAGLEGWYSSDLTRSDFVPIEPQQGIQVLRKQAGDVLFTRAGHVKVGDTKLNVKPGLNVMGNPRAVGMDDTPAPVFTLGTSGLWNPDDLANSVDPGDQADNADQVIVFTDTEEFDQAIYFRAEIPDVVSGWFDTFLNPADDAVIENGTAFLIDRTGGGEFVWTVPAETIAE